MKKSTVSLGLLISLLAVSGCKAQAKANTVTLDGNKYDVMFTYKDGDKEETYTANDAYGEMLDSTSGSSAIFDAVYKKVIEESIDSNKKKEIEKEVEEEMVTWLQDAKDQASDNGVSRDTMIDALLEEEGVDSTEELTEKKIYEKQKKYAEDDYFDTNRNSGLNLVEEYVDNYFPVHVKGILVKVADTNHTYFARSISEDETKKLARTTNALMEGKDFNVLACDSTFSDHSTSQITTGGDLGIMDATTSFNNEYKLGIYTYFAYANSATGDAKILEKIGVRDTNKASYDALYGEGFNVITKDQVQYLKDSAERTKYADGKLVVSTTEDGDYKSLNLPRNVIYNNFFNSHKVSFMAADASVSADRKVTVDCAKGDSGRETREVLANRYGYPILVLTDENGVQFISIEMDSFENSDAAVKYFGSTESSSFKETVNGAERTFTPYIAQAGTSKRASRKETVDTQIKNFINKGFNSTISANQDFYYYRIYNEFIGNVEGETLKQDELKKLYGDSYETSPYYSQLTSYIKSIEDYREVLIDNAQEDTWEAFAKTLNLQESYVANGWVRPLWLAEPDKGFFLAAEAQAGDKDRKYWNSNLGGGKL